MTAWLRLDLRRRARSLAVLALLVALASGAVVAATAGARRGASAMDRLLALTLPATAMVQPNEPGFDWAAVRRLPGVEALAAFPLSDVRLEERPGAPVGYPLADGEAFRSIERPVVVAGRAPDLARVDEAVTTQAFLDLHGLRLGDTVTARLRTPEEVDRSGDDAEPTGPRQPIHIVGVVRTPILVSTPELTTTPAFATRYRANLVGTTDQMPYNAIVRLSGGAAGLPAFRRDFAALTGRSDIEIVDLAAQADAVDASDDFEAAVLLAIALAALLAAAVLLGQAVVRFTAASLADLGTLRTLGLTGRQALLAAAAGPALASVAGVLAGSAAAVAVSPLFPIGAARAVDPSPGVRPDWTVVAGIGVLVVGLMAAAAGLAGSPGQRPFRRSAAATAAYRLGLPVPAVVGIRHALEPGRGLGAVPVRPALVGAVVGVLGVLGALTFRAGVVDAAGEPARFGQVTALSAWAGYGGQDFGPYRPALARVAADPDVAAVNDSLVGVVTVGPASVTVYTAAPVDRRPLPVEPISGRMPAGPGEIALAPTALRDAGVSVGDTVAVGARSSARMTVVGEAFVPEGPHNGYAAGGWLTPAGFRALFPDGSFKFHQVHVALRPRADPGAVAARISAGGSPLSFEPAQEPAQVARIREVAALPLALGAFLALLAVGATGHSLATAVRRRRHDLAVLRALGMTRRQGRIVVLAQAGTLAAVGLLLGAPLGVAAGRLLWRVVADTTPLSYVPPVARVALLLAVPVALVVVLALAVLPARRVARLRVADVLAAE
ncbi:MAG TPA: FtsX-like permease family protein [Mycobacteriales bacterium]